MLHHSSPHLSTKGIEVGATAVFPVGFSRVHRDDLAGRMRQLVHVRATRKSVIQASFAALGLLGGLADTDDRHAFNRAPRHCLVGDYATIERGSVLGLRSRTAAMLAQTEAAPAGSRRRGRGARRHLRSHPRDRCRGGQHRRGRSAAVQGWAVASRAGGGAVPKTSPRSASAAA
ncbi:hypothetical protein MPAR168_06625 [Methylorubrum populi]